MQGEESNFNLTSLKSSLYSSSFRMRCPDCFKSYTVDWADVHELQPRFECVTCHTHFYVEAAQAVNTLTEIIGVKENHFENSHDLNDVTESLFNCPKCSAPYSAGENECKKCGVIFLKFAEKKLHKLSEVGDTSITASGELKSLWEDVLNDFENEIAHQKFINAAWAEASMDYAAAKYRGILDVVPNDEWALKAQNRIRDLNSIKFEIQADEEASVFKKWFQDLDMVDFVQTHFKKLRFTNILMFACAIIIIMGVFTPGMRNLIGFGTSVLFFILALRFYFRVI